MPERNNCFAIPFTRASSRDPNQVERFRAPIVKIVSRWGWKIFGK